MFTIRISPLLTFLALIPCQCLAVNFYDGARAPEGLYFLTYTSAYYADTTTDATGNTSRNDYGYGKFEELFRLCYYKGNTVVTAFVPAGIVRSGVYDTTSSGIGDITAGAGYFLPFKKTDILPMVFVKLANGAYSSGNAINYGSNQYDIKPVIFLYKNFGRFSLDGSARYARRLENHATDTLPGDELYLQCLLGWQIRKWCKTGPSINWMKSGKRKTRGEPVSGSERESISAGADLYVRLPRISVTVTCLRDLYSENTTKGDFVQVKTCCKF